MVHRIGLNELLSEPYWKLVHKLSRDVQSHTINGQNIDFKTESLTEFMRFRSLAGECSILDDLLCSLEADDIFYDIGANVGTYTCFVASKLGPHRTVAFEPEPENAAQLRANLELNNLEAEIIEVALSDFSGTVDLALSGNESGEGEHAIATGQEKETIKVEVARGDEVIEQEELSPPSVVKIDVEGAELSVLRGLRETLQEHVRLSYVEVHPDKLPEFGDTPIEVRDFLIGAGFDVTEISTQREHIFLRASK